MERDDGGSKSRFPVPGAMLKLLLLPSPVVFPLREFPVSRQAAAMLKPPMFAILVRTRSAELPAIW